MERLTKPSKAGTKYVSAIGSGCGSWGKIMDKEENAHLTQKELKNMGGTPVWIVDKKAGTEGWELSQDAYDYWEDRDLKEYGKTWFAFRRPPKEVLESG